jgi:hypothetical protein
MALTKLAVLTCGAYFAVAVGLGVLLGTGVTVAVGASVAGAPTVTTEGVEMVAVGLGPVVGTVVVEEVCDGCEVWAVFGDGSTEHPAINEATANRQTR